MHRPRRRGPTRLPRTGGAVAKHHSAVYKTSTSDEALFASCGQRRLTPQPAVNCVLVPHTRRRAPVGEPRPTSAHHVHPYRSVDPSVKDHNFQGGTTPLRKQRISGTAATRLPRRRTRTPRSTKPHCPRRVECRPGRCRIRLLITVNVHSGPRGWHDRGGWPW